MNNYEPDKMSSKDLKEVKLGDWIYNIGDIDSLELLGFLHNLGQNGYVIRKEE